MGIRRLTNKIGCNGSDIPNSVFGSFFDAMCEQGLIGIVPVDERGGGKSQVISDIIEKVCAVDGKHQSAKCINTADLFEGQFTLCSAAAGVVVSEDDSVA